MQHGTMYSGDHHACRGGSVGNFDGLEGKRRRQGKGQTEDLSRGGKVPAARFALKGESEVGAKESL